jgi:hypothetical protein
VVAVVIVVLFIIELVGETKLATISNTGLSESQRSTLFIVIATTTTIIADLGE